jgi:heme/copper-type cytochrome/quinol oxidase subunit 4
MSYGPDDTAWMMIFILAIIGLLSAVAGVVWVIAWLIQHMRFV